MADTPDQATNDLTTERDYRLLSGLLSGLVSLAVLLLILAVVLGRQADQDLRASRACALLSSDALWVYSVVPHSKIVPPAATDSAPMVLLRPPEAADFDTASSPAAAPPTPTPDSIFPPPALLSSESPPLEDWHPLMRGMVWQHDRLRKLFPSELGQSDGSWRRFAGTLRESGQLQWDETTALSASLRGAGDSLQDQAAAQRGLALTFIVTGLLILVVLFSWTKGLMGRRREKSVRVEAALQRLETVLEAAGEGVYQVDAHGSCTYINSAAASLLGYRAKELRGKNMARLLYHHRDGILLQPDGGISQDYGPEENPVQRALNTGEAAREDDDSIRRRDGSSFAAATVASPMLTDRGLRGVVVTFSDITDRKSAEVLRDDLTGMIVHDLRTPLTSLLTGLQTLALAGELNPAQEEMLGIATGGGETLLGMVGDLLDISKMEAGGIRLEKRAVNGAEVIEQALRQTAALAARNGLRVARHLALDLPMVQADEEKLRRALVNLLGNAVKFTPRGGIVTIAASYDAAEQAVVFAVGDTGEGIPAHALKRIFEKFGQVESRKAGRKMSTGLGLTFCKLVAESHGGRIWVESKLGKGSRFLFTIPAPKATSELPENKPSAGNV